MKKIYTANRETGTFIEEFPTVEEARKAIIDYEEKDKADGIYEENFYDIVDENHHTLRMVYLKKSKNGCLDGIAKGYTKEYVEEKIADGYEEISKARYDEIMHGSSLAISYDYE